MSAQRASNPREIVGGVYHAHVVRRARKAYQCDGAYGIGVNYRRCLTIILEGSYYVEGDIDPYRAGGFGHDRLCSSCVDDAARAAIAKAEGRS